MWHTKVQVCSEDLSMRVVLEESMVVSVMVPTKPSCVLVETWVIQSRRYWAEKSLAFISWRLRSLKPVIAVSFILTTVASG